MKTLKILWITLVLVFLEISPGSCQNRLINASASAINATTNAFNASATATANAINATAQTVVNSLEAINEFLDTNKKYMKRMIGTDPDSKMIDLVPKMSTFNLTQIKECYDMSIGEDDNYNLFENTIFASVKTFYKHFSDNFNIPKFPSKMKNLFESFNEIGKQTVACIANPSTYKLGLTQLSDFDDKEYKALLGAKYEDVKSSTLYDRFLRRFDENDNIGSGNTANNNKKKQSIGQSIANIFNRNGKVQNETESGSSNQRRPAEESNNNRQNQNSDRDFSTNNSQNQNQNRNRQDSDDDELSNSQLRNQNRNTQNNRQNQNSDRDFSTNNSQNQNQNRNRQDSNDDEQSNSQLRNQNRNNQNNRQNQNSDRDFSTNNSQNQNQNRNRQDSNDDELSNSQLRNQNRNNQNNRQNQNSDRDFSTNNSQNQNRQSSQGNNSQNQANRQNQDLSNDRQSSSNRNQFGEDSQGSRQSSNRRTQNNSPSLEEAVPTIDTSRQNNRQNSDSGRNNEQSFNQELPTSSRQNQNRNNQANRGNSEDERSTNRNNSNRSSIDDDLPQGTRQGSQSNRQTTNSEFDTDNRSNRRQNSNDNVRQSTNRNDQNNLETDENFSNNRRNSQNNRQNSNEESNLPSRNNQNRQSLNRDELPQNTRQTSNSRNFNTENDSLGSRSNNLNRETSTSNPLGRFRRQAKSVEAACIPKDRRPLPAKFDWRANYKVTPVRYQGSCGSCWAFSALASLESVYLIKGKSKNMKLDLSEQELLGCAKKDGCDGGTAVDAFNFILRNKGVSDESSLKYSNKDNNCARQSKKVAIIKDYCLRGVYVKKDGKPEQLSDEDIQYVIREFGPVYATINADDIAVKNLKTGIYNNKKCPKKTNHAITVVGWDEKSWIIKNSWGKSWGDKGFFRMKRGENMCGLNTYIMFPIV